MPVLAEYHLIDFRQIHWLRGKIPLRFVEMKRQLFGHSVALTLWFCCLYESEIDNYFGRNV